MITAKHLRQTNIAEYILYLWQIEDLIRAFNFDIEKITAQYTLTGEELSETKFWYENLVKMMEIEKITKSGHLQVVENLIGDLDDLHLKLLQMPGQSAYHKFYTEAQNHIQLFKQKMNSSAQNEINIAFHAMYATALLKIQKKDIGPDTGLAVKSIGKLLASLAEKYHDFEKKPENYIS